MAKADFVRGRIEPDVKTKAEKIFKRLGLTTSQALSLFYHQVILYKGLPFEVRIPNEKTLQTFRDTDAGENLREWSSLDDYVKSMGAQ
ncbi:MAG: type II toxin-antitoxin system RelB/DinJ family antitoxin [Thermodesulfobacteriota bacterium]